LPLQRRRGDNHGHSRHATILIDYAAGQVADAGLRRGRPCQSKRKDHYTDYETRNSESHHYLLLHFDSTCFLPSEFLFSQDETSSTAFLPAPLVTSFSKHLSILRNYNNSFRNIDASLVRTSHRVSTADGESLRPAVLVANRGPQRGTTTPAAPGSHQIRRILALRRPRYETR